MKSCRGRAPDRGSENGDSLCSSARLTRLARSILNRLDRGCPWPPIPSGHCRGAHLFACSHCSLDLDAPLFCDLHSARYACVRACVLGCVLGCALDVKQFISVISCWAGVRTHSVPLAVHRSLGRVRPSSVPAVPRLFRSCVLDCYPACPGSWILVRPLGRGNSSYRSYRARRARRRDAAHGALRPRSRSCSSHYNNRTAWLCQASTSYGEALSRVAPDAGRVARPTPTVERRLSRGLRGMPSPDPCC